MNRFFVNKKHGEFFILNEAELKHLKVLKIKNENFICVFEEKFFICKLFDNKAKIIEEIKKNNEHKNKVVLFMSIIKIKNLEWALQKSTELGVSEIYLIKTKNTNKKYIDKINHSKYIRFREIIKSAAEQSFRNKIPKLFEMISFDESIMLNLTKNKIIAHEKEENKKKILFEDDISIFIGPEGGFSNDEIEKASEQNIKMVSLGKTILRSETAAITSLSLIE